MGTKLKDKTREATLHDELDDCKDCAINTYNPFPGLGSECFPCLSAKTTRADSCGGCNPGTWKDSANEVCVDCVPGKYR